MLLMVQTGSGDIIERMWRRVVSARKNDDSPLMWRLTEDILDAVQAFYYLGRDAVTPTDATDRGLRTAPGRVERFWMCRWTRRPRCRTCFAAPMWCITCKCM